jgi:hypothetical protein
MTLSNDITDRVWDLAVGVLSAAIWGARGRLLDDLRRVGQGVLRLLKDWFVQ